MKAEYDPEDVLFVLDLGTAYEADIQTPYGFITVRLCTMCYEVQERIRSGNKGDSFMGEESMCMAHWSRKEANVTEAGMRLPIGGQGRPTVNLGACTVDGCDRPQKTKQLCNAHYVAEFRAKANDTTTSLASEAKTVIR